MIKDRYNRTHNYLRISLTDNCNLRCFYCMPEADYDFTPAAHLMRQEEIVQLAEIFIREGVNKIRLTGGEPLVRKDAAGIIAALGQLDAELTITTNGTRVHEFLDVFRSAGIRRLNVSLDTLDADRFLLLTRRDQHARVMKNIYALLDHGFGVKINVVLMKGVNDGEINQFIAWTRDLPLEIRFIEFMPFTGNRWSDVKVFSLQELLDRVSETFTYMPVPGSANDTAKHYQVPGHQGSFAVISTMTAPFCGSCNRIRLTADGKLKNCLFSRGETDLLSTLRSGGDVRPLIHRNIRDKAEALGGQFTAAPGTISADTIHNRSMITIGG